MIAPPTKMKMYVPIMDEMKSLLTAMREENRQHFATLSLHIDTIKSELKDLNTEVTDLRLSLSSLDRDVTDIKDETIPELRKQLFQEITNLKQQHVPSKHYCNGPIMAL
jgi:predicted  nucleic acid-binding Zn-ribbon protein